MPRNPDKYWVRLRRGYVNLLESRAVSRNEQQAHNVVRDLTQTGENCWDRKLLLLPPSLSPLEGRWFLASSLSDAAVQAQASEQLYIENVTW